jgi:hypothetical protein
MKNTAHAFGWDTPPASDHWHPTTPTTTGNPKESDSPSSQQQLRKSLAGYDDENSDSTQTTTGNPKESDRLLWQRQPPSSLAGYYDYDDDESHEDDDKSCDDDGKSYDYDGDKSYDYDGDKPYNDDEGGCLNEYETFGQERGLVELRMLPIRGAAERPAALPWVAVLEVKCRDVARLMREGLFWTAGNIVPGKDYISWETRPENRSLGYHYKRTWILVDKSKGQARQWVGRLEVMSPRADLLLGFQVQDLSTDDVYAATATNGFRHCIYNFDRRFSHHNYNCIYGRKPLKGWWPWPRDDPEEGNCNAAFPDVGAGKVFPLPRVARSWLDAWHCQPNGGVIL